MGRVGARHAPRRASTGTALLLQSRQRERIALHRQHLQDANPFKVLQSPERPHRRKSRATRPRRGRKAQQEPPGILAEEGRSSAAGGGKASEDRDDYESVQAKFRALKRAVQNQITAWHAKSSLAHLAARQTFSRCSASLMERMQARFERLARPLRLPSSVSALQTEVAQLQSRLDKFETIVRERQLAPASAPHLAASNATAAPGSAAPPAAGAAAAAAAAAAIAARTRGAPSQHQNVSSRSSSSSSSSSSAVNQDPAYAKYRRMLSFGVPRSAVDQAMAKDGVDPRGLDGPVPSGAGGAPAARKPAPAFSASALRQVRLRNAGSASSSKTSNPKTPQRAASRGVISLEALQGVKLRATPQKQQNPPRARGNTPGAILSLEQLQQVKLRPSTPLTSGKENCKNSGNKQVSFRLRKTALDRSPGGTPSKTHKAGPSRHARAAVSSRFANRTPLQERSPSRARSDGEFLELALRRKFASLHAMRQTSPAQQQQQQWSPGSFLV